MRQWWSLVGRPQSTVLVIHPLFLSFSLLLKICVHIFFIFFQHILTAYFMLECSPFSWQMGPVMGKYPDPKPRRRRTLVFFVVGCKWGVSCSSGGGGMGAFVGGGFTFLSLFLYSVHMAFYSPLYSYSCILFYLSETGPAEKGWFPVGGGLQI